MQGAWLARRRPRAEPRVELCDVELNTKGRYAVTAMADLAKYGAGGAVPLSAIAERQQISLAYLEQLFAKLRRAGLVESARGRAGGYRLGRPADTISVGEVMTAVEEGIRMTRCGGEDSVPCLAGKRCLTHGLWDALGDQIATFLDSVTLQEVLDGIPPGKQAARAAAVAPVAVRAE
jgi:Rrf2 family protein